MQVQGVNIIPERKFQITDSMAHYKIVGIVLNINYLTHSCLKSVEIYTIIRETECVYNYRIKLPLQISRI